MDDTRPSILSGKSLLVTGGTGSLGRALVTRALADGAARVVIYSRDELKQAEMLEAVADDRCRYFLGCVRDLPRLTRAMEGVDYVIHAAALKRIEAGEQDASEFVKTNVLGTMNVIDAAHAARVERVVFVSTDKASQSSTLYGSSKHTAERLIRAANNARGAFGPIYAAVRYGNVAASRGSVIPLWRAMAARGETATLRDPDATRYFMRLEESVALVVWTLAHMTGGDLVVPDLPAYRVSDLAVALGIGWRLGSLANGEKRHESMIGADEVPAFRRHGPYWSTTGTGEPLPAPLASDTAPRLSASEIRARIAALYGESPSRTDDRRDHDRHPARAV